MKAAWGKHEADCNKVVEARETVKQTGAEVTGVPCRIDPEAMLCLNRRALDVYEKHGVSEPPGRGSKMDVGKKLAFFLDVLKEHDSSSPENRNLPLAEKLFLNRRFNNTYKHAMETFPPNELNRLNTLMKTNHVGAANREP
ncbi:hypothetical protein V7S43_000274 [Phytophthora oleae]|uniref:Uncharacterized protein n=1 Tax=Phytophthora oleae TaxID=2107226 RepID=A0ABD3G955_9STRA